MPTRKDLYESSFTPSQPRRAFVAKLGRVGFEPAAEPWGALPGKWAFTSSVVSRRRERAKLSLTAAALAQGGRVVLEDGVARAFTDAFLEGAEGDWTYESSLQPAGSAGAMGSVWWRRYQASGGVSPLISVSLASFDAASEKQVDLRELLGDSLLSEVTNRVRDALRQSENGDLFAHEHTALAAQISSSFRPGAAPGTLLIAVPAAIRAAFGTVAEVLVTGPTIPALHPEK